MHTQQNYGITSPNPGQFESSLEMWERLCEMWDSALQRAQVIGDSNQAARAELTLGMCERERGRVEMLSRSRRA